MQKTAYGLSQCLPCCIVFMVMLGCRHADRVDLSDHLVASPISPRANTVLANLIQDCPTTAGEWVRHHGDPGCVELFGTLFAYRAGLRRSRDDLIAIGRVSGRNEARKLIRLLNRMIWNRQGVAFDELTGTPALLVSGTSGGDDFHYGLFVSLTDQMLGRLESLDFSVTQNAATAYLLAEMYRLDSHHEDVWIEKARLCADRIADKGWSACFRAFAWTAIAKATGESGDFDRAKVTIRPVLPTFTDTKKGRRFAGPYADVLSCHLFLAHGLADLSQLEPHGDWRGRAMEIVDYVFSDTYFDGRFLAHHIENGEPADVHCTGCNFHALYLADRLYGDALLLDSGTK